MTAKMVSRHPHVFGGDREAETADDVVAFWDDLKADEKPHRTSVLDGIPRGMPALALAQKVIGKAEKAGVVVERFGCRGARARHGGRARSRAVLARGIRSLAGTRRGAGPAARRARLRGRGACGRARCCPRRRGAGRGRRRRRPLSRAQASPSPSRHVGCDGVQPSDRARPLSAARPGAPATSSSASPV